MAMDSTLSLLLQQVLAQFVPHLKPRNPPWLADIDRVTSCAALSMYCFIRGEPQHRAANLPQPLGRCTRQHGTERSPVPTFPVERSGATDPHTQFTRPQRT